ncbi:PIG-L deacetylase family protein [Pedobacter cryoconitis]|uniref:LmbE family N-acetylglucosaminyl deacetylase n=1 Tax=Pedobacter cryoconitis TaxID=188932 RepID=A0A7X0IZB7_9SPHI|nr:PIG-L family deacetylase [Pedobacter cryoconitis]MBB6498209.1 LmbE family N-acetylglucosaminyl deacetylase [Pedobacter cryoconitis]
MKDKTGRKVAIIVAHPDDETLWAGGTILANPSWQYFIASLCRSKDQDRAPKFKVLLDTLGAEGKMADLDDGPEQIPLDENEVEKTILKILPGQSFDLVISHHPNGEYTRHRRHEETSRAVIKLWHKGLLAIKELWLFAYEDGNKKYYPQARQTADLYFLLSAEVWQEKYKLVTSLYGFQENSWEARTTPKEESFWRFTNSEKAMNYLLQNTPL